MSSIDCVNENVESDIIELCREAADFPQLSQNSYSECTCNKSNFEQLEVLDHQFTVERTSIHEFCFFPCVPLE